MLRSPIASAISSNVLFTKHAAGGILRRVQNDQPGTIVDQRGQFIHIETKIFLFTQADRHRAAADVVDHGLVNREARIGINNLIPDIS